MKLNWEFSFESCENIFGKTISKKVQEGFIDKSLIEEMVVDIMNCNDAKKKKELLEAYYCDIHKKSFMDAKNKEYLLTNKDLLHDLFLKFEEYECNAFLKKIENIQVLLSKIPKHVFSGIDKEGFLEFIENVFINIENIDEINTQAAVSFLKLKFMSGIIDIDSAVIMIKNQCRK